MIWEDFMVRIKNIPRTTKYCNHSKSNIPHTTDLYSVTTTVVEWIDKTIHSNAIHITHIVSISRHLITTWNEYSAVSSTTIIFTLYLQQKIAEHHYSSHYTIIRIHCTIRHFSCIWLDTLSYYPGQTHKSSPGTEWQTSTTYSLFPAAVESTIFQFGSLVLFLYHVIL